MSEMMQDVAYLLYGQPFQIPVQFAFTGRAVGILVGISTGLAPEFNFVEFAAPYARKSLGLGMNAEGAEQTLRHLFSRVLETGRVLLTLPLSLERVLTRLESGPIEVRHVNSGQGRWMRSRGCGSRRDRSESPLPGFTWFFMFVASLAGGIFLMSDAHQFIAGWFCFGLVGLITLAMLLKS
jgi:predicted unusual protein kinase regulating ubiquinone biosynthesis (AarF/ABC1/UbiB family)